MSIDLIIPLGKHSPFLNEELRFCLRSIEKYLTGYRNIYIIGEKPEWLTNIIHIPMTDKSSHEKNILNKILAACEHEDISDEFIFFNDDHFLLKQTEATSYPYYYSGTITDKLRKREMFTPYKQVCINTESVLKIANKNNKLFDIHCPIRYKKGAFKEVMSRYNWKCVIGGYIIKSLYCNTLNIEGIPMLDCKIGGEVHQLALADQLYGRHVFSVGDPGFPSVKPMLENMFYNKSKYEL